MKSVEYYVEQLHKKIDKCLENNRVQDAIYLMASCANIEYQANNTYKDDYLEDKISIIANNYSTKEYDSNNTILFFDGFGLDNRGLSSIYLEALSKYTKIVYVTYTKDKKEIPNIVNYVDKSNGEIIFIDHKNNFDNIYKLIEIVNEYKPKCLFKYNEPNDIVSAIFFKLVVNKATRYHINLTDDAFWTGVDCFDYIIDFRSFGSCINNKYRMIEKNKIILLPMYPSITDEKLNDLPFDFDGKKLIFSGGQLYKTISEDNNFYKLVDYILSNYEDTIFYYLGNGDTTRIGELCCKYKDRCFVENERKDFFEIIKKSYFTLTTYPICGGLMIQYSAAAGKIPLTLKGDSSEGLLLGNIQDKFEFERLEDIKNAIDKLMIDINSLEVTSNDLINSIVNKDQFTNEINDILNNSKTCFEIDYDTTNNDMVINQSKHLMEENILILNSLINEEYSFMFKYFPKETIYLIFDKIIKKVKRNLWK